MATLGAVCFRGFGAWASRRRTWRLSAEVHVEEARSAHESTYAEMVDDGKALTGVCAGNLVRLLSWWAPPPEVEAPVEMGICDWCKKSFPMRVNEYFTKFSFQYCG